MDIPVSYTHLDVYKRQVQRCPELVFHSSWPGVVLDTSRAVSYTHLDVYKRQVLDTSRVQRRYPAGCGPGYT